MKRLALLLGILLLLSLAVAVSLFRARDRETIKTVDAVQFVRDVLKLSVVEIHVSQLYEVNRDNLRISEIPVPWTGQKSLIAVKGTASLGYDLTQAHVASPEDKKEIQVRLPPPSVLSVDVNYRFLHEEDTFLNRLKPEDRNDFLRSIKEEVRKGLLTQHALARIEGRTKKLLEECGRVLGRTVNLLGRPAV